MTRSWKVLGGAALALVLTGCPPKDDQKPDNKPGVPGATAAADIQGKDGLTGRATFTQKEGGKVQVHVEVKGAPPGDHGVHVHEKGDCSDAEFKSAGGHFNPHQTAHGGPTSTPRHPGDFGNMAVGADGTGVVDLETEMLTVGGGSLSVVGKSIIFHAGTDDLTTQPTGNAGGRLGCGVIKEGQ